jgi:hypothetical protein
VSQHLDYDGLRADTVRQVAKLMAAAAITAPKSGGMLFLQGKHLFIETVIVDDHDALHQLAEWMRARGVERRETIWFRDADVADAIDAVLFVVVMAVSAAGGSIAWNVILRATHAEEFFTDAPIAVFPASWQDFGSGVFTLATASVLLGLGPLRNTMARRVTTLALLAGAGAFLVDIYLY